LGEASNSTRATDPLDYDPIEYWLRDSRSEASKKSRKKILDRFLEWNETSARDMLLLAREIPSGIRQIKIENMVDNFLEYRHKNRNEGGCGIATSTVAKEADIIKGFFWANNVIVNTPRKYVLKPVYESERVLTQDEVRKMIKVTIELDKRAIICVEAQAAQRISILTGLRFDMIHRYPQEDGKVYGVVDVKPEISDREGRPVNKTRVHYKFGLHWESMSLLDEIRQQREDKNGFIWTLIVRRMQELISDAAKVAGIQKATTRRTGDEWHDVHAHVFRRYWVARMDDAKVTNNYLIDYQLGHLIPSDGTYYHGMFTDEKIIEAIKQADEHLRVLT
jgi:integrase